MTTRRDANERVKLVPLADIDSGGRHRKDMGDLDTLVQSIGEVGGELSFLVVCHRGLHRLSGGRKAIHARRVEPGASAAAGDRQDREQKAATQTPFHGSFLHA